MSGWHTGRPKAKRRGLTLHQQKRKMTPAEIAHVTEACDVLHEHFMRKRVRITITTDVTRVGSEFIYLDGKGVPILDVEEVEVIADSQWELDKELLCGHYVRAK